MGGCCSAQVKFEVVKDRERYHREIDEDEIDVTRPGDFGARVRVQGSSKYCSMYTRQGRKGVNQDAMTIWEDFIGEKGTYFCGVFDGHGPYGDRIAGHISDYLPSKLSANIKLAQVNNINRANPDVKTSPTDQLYSMLESSILKSFKEVDEELKLAGSVDTYCSGTTAVVVIKQGDNLMVANLGDSRAVLCTRGYRNEPIPAQLTVDLKPNVASEAERIKSCKGRVFPMDEEPEVFRVWMPEENSPGLAMTRAFGDFCLKDYGLISTPQVFYRKLTKNDEFIVLATDGIWDVLSNDEVVKIVASARKRSLAAKLLVSRAVRTWRTKYPGSKVDDCAVVILFLKDPEMSLDPMFVSYNSRTTKAEPKYHDHDIIFESIAEDESAVEEVSRVNTLVNLPGKANNGNTKR